MKKKDNILTNHHKIAKEHWWSNHFDNLLKIKLQQHQALHILFGNRLPHTQLQMIIDMTGMAFNKRFTTDFESLLQGRTVDEIYNTKCYLQRILKL